MDLLTQLVDFRIFCNSNNSNYSEQLIKHDLQSLVDFD